MDHSPMTVLQLGSVRDSLTHLSSPRILCKLVNCLVAIGTVTCDVLPSHELGEATFDLDTCRY